MKKLQFKSILFFCLISVLAVLVLSYKSSTKKNIPADVLKTSTHIVTVNSNTFRDLNKNGKLDIYEDVHQPTEARINDLLSQMNIEEKAGMMFINGARINDDGTIDDKPGKGMFAFAPNAMMLVKDKKMNHFNLWAIPAVEMLAKWYNAMQKYVEDSTRLGIPITIASDPRSHFTQNIFAMAGTNFSQWCEPLGLAAIGDEKLTHEFADDVRQEYLAVGIRESLHPQIDLSTEP